MTSSRVLSEAVLLGSAAFCIAMHLGSWAFLVRHMTRLEQRLDCLTTKLNSLLAFNEASGAVNVPLLGSHDGLDNDYDSESSDSWHIGALSHSSDVSGRAS